MKTLKSSHHCKNSCPLPQLGLYVDMVPNHAEMGGYPREKKESVVLSDTLEVLSRIEVCPPLASEQLPLPPLPCPLPSTRCNCCSPCLEAKAMPRLKSSDTTARTSTDQPSNEERLLGARRRACRMKGTDV